MYVVRVYSSSNGWMMIGESFVMNFSRFQGNIIVFLRFHFVQAADASAIMDLIPSGEVNDEMKKQASFGSTAAPFQQQIYPSSLLPLFAAETLAAACRSAGVPIR